jgi:electron transport complex protein RnfD
MASFPVAMTTWARPFDIQPLGVDAVSGATPLAAAKFGTGAVPGLWPLLVGDVGGSIGETSAFAILLGGAFLLLRRAADWRQPLGVLSGAGAFAAAAHALAPDRFVGLPIHLTSGALMFGAFFIATDPVGCPLTPRGRLFFGLGVGVLVMVIRLFGGYPEGVMFAVLLMNALTPLIERWTRPEPFGGRSEP